MNSNELNELILLEFENFDKLESEIQQILDETQNKKPSQRTITASGAFLSQFYNGVENILKRVIRFENLSIPTGDGWHVELMKMFKTKNSSSNHLTIDDNLYKNLALYRRFRHVIRNSYGFELDWPKLLPGLEKFSATSFQLKQILNTYLDSINNQEK